MYAAFPPTRTVNPLAWDTKMQFWNKVLSQGLSSGLLLSSSSKYRFEAKELSYLLSENGIPPMGLPKVLMTLWESGEITLESTFLNPASSSSSTSSSWVVSLFTMPIQWIVSLVSSPPSSKVIPDEPFVAISLLKNDESFLTKFIKSRTSLSEKLMTSDEFMHLIDWPDSNFEKDLIILLHYAHSKGFLQFDAKHSFIKLSSEPISETDQKVLDIKYTMEKIQQQIDELESKMLNAQNEAKQLLREGKKPKALRSLRSKKCYEPLLDNRLVQLSTLQSILLKIDACETESAVLLAYQAGTTALQKMLAKPELQKVDETMASLQEVLLDHQAIDDAIGGITLEVFDDNELEKELDALTASPSLASQPSRVTTSKREDVKGLLNNLKTLQVVPTSPLSPHIISPTSLSFVSLKEPERRVSIPN